MYSMPLANVAAPCMFLVVEKLYRRLPLVQSRTSMLKPACAATRPLAITAAPQCRPDVPCCQRILPVAAHSAVSLPPYAVPFRVVLPAATNSTPLVQATAPFVRLPG